MHMTDSHGPQPHMGSFLTRYLSPDSSFAAQMPPSTPSNARPENLNRHTMSSRMFEGATVGAINNSTFVINTHSQKSAFDRLEAAAAHSALHDAPARTDESRCHQYTRVNVLDNLERWAQGLCDEGAPILWLHGGAGAGKSAVMQTLAERCVAQKLTLGSFFFSRSDLTRNTAEVLIPTLVYQLALLFPSVLQALDSTINQGSVKKSFEAQLCNLLVPALQHLVQRGSISNTPSSPRVFLIDGLDECSDAAHQQEIIQAVAKVCHEHHLPVKFLIASRPESAISASFECYREENRVLGTISLSEDPDAEDDIRRFFEDEFLNIRLQHTFKKMIPSEWPNLYDINELVWKSSSHFIYAKTAMRYIWSAKETPVRSLQVILGLEVSRTISPFAELDALYYHILGLVAHQDKVLQILAHSLFSSLPSSAGVICTMLKCSPNDFLIYMADMTPLVAFPQLASDFRENVKVLHASLADFLCNQSRSKSLYVNKEIFLVSQLDRCLQLLTPASQIPGAWHKWPSTIDMVSEQIGYKDLREQVLETFSISSHLAITQQILRQYSLHLLNQCQVQYYNSLQRRPSSSGTSVWYRTFRPGTITEFLLIVQSIKTVDGVKLFRDFLDEFFDILDAQICEESMPLASAILPLIFLGYPSQGVQDIHCYHSGYKDSYRLIAAKSYNKAGKSVTALDIITSADLASVHHSSTIHPKSLAVAAEAILGYLIDSNDIKLDWLSTCSVTIHKAWLRQTKPGKHTATGAPRLASVFHAKCVQYLTHLVKKNVMEPYDRDHPKYLFGLQLHLQHIPLHMIQKPQAQSIDPEYALAKWNDKARMVASLLIALLWVLPKAGASEKILLYSKRIFPQVICQSNASLVRRVQRCLDKYNIRVQSTKLEDLDQRIENGDVNALIEKSKMLYLDTQD